MRVLSFAILSALSVGSYGLRDAEAEEHCQRFLTDPRTAPISPTANRDLAIDNEAETYCRRVLEDAHLPLQIKGVVLEGLAYVLEQQSAMGLASREEDAMELHKEMVMSFPDSARFLWRAAVYAHEVMEQPEEAVRALKARVDDVAENEAGEKGLAKRLLSRLQVQQGDLEDAAITLVEALEKNATDFHSADVLKDLLSTQLDSIVGLETATGEPRDGEAAAAAVLEASAAAHDRVTKLATSDYEGFVPPSAAWSPTRLTTVPTVDEFEAYIERREPVIVSLGTDLDQALGWSTSKWTDEYFIDTAGDITVDVEEAPRSFMDGPNPAVGGGSVEITRTTMTFGEWVATFFKYPSFEKLAELNIQRSSKDGIYLGPLANLKADIEPIPPFLDGVAAGSQGQYMSQVISWMGHTGSEGSSTTTRAHADSEDCLYVLLRGAKHFTVLSPAHHGAVKTISPTYHVAKNGLGFRGATDVEARSTDHFAEFGTDLTSAEAAVSFKLEAGELLYLPTGWTHQEESSGGQHVTLNWWWRPPGWQNATSDEAAALEGLITQLKRGKRWRTHGEL